MIVLTAHVTIKQGEQAEFVQNAQDCIRETRKEKGNISYTLLADTENSCKFMFFEEWESQTALDLHAETVHFKRFGAATKDLMDAPLAIDIYEASKK